MPDAGSIAEYPGRLAATTTKGRDVTTQTEMMIQNAEVVFDVLARSAYVLIRQHGSKEIPPRTLTELLVVGETVVLEPFEIGGRQAFVRPKDQIRDQFLRVFVRPDKMTVLVDDDFCTLVERSFEEPLVWCQAIESALAKVVVSRAHGEAPLALVMPIRAT